MGRGGAQGRAAGQGVGRGSGPSAAPCSCGQAHPARVQALDRAQGQGGHHGAGGSAWLGGQAPHRPGAGSLRPCSARRESAARGACAPGGTGVRELRSCCGSAGSCSRGLGLAGRQAPRGDCAGLPGEAPFAQGCSLCAPPLQPMRRQGAQRQAPCVLHWRAPGSGRRPGLLPGLLELRAAGAGQRGGRPARLPGRGVRGRGMGMLLTPGWRHVAACPGRGYPHSSLQRRAGRGPASDFGRSQTPCEAH